MMFAWSYDPNHTDKHDLVWAFGTAVIDHGVVGVEDPIMAV